MTARTLPAIFAEGFGLWVDARVRLKNKILTNWSPKGKNTKNPAGIGGA